MKTLKLKTNKSGNKVALVSLNNKAFLVYIQKTNYMQGKNVTKWYVCNSHAKQGHKDFQSMAKNGMEENKAVLLFNRKSK